LTGADLLAAAARLNHLWFRSRGQVGKRDPATKVSDGVQAARWRNLIRLVTRTDGTDQISRLTRTWFVEATIRSFQPADSVSRSDDRQAAFTARQTCRTAIVPAAGHVRLVRASFRTVRVASRSSWPDSNRTTELETQQPRRRERYPDQAAERCWQLAIELSSQLQRLLADCPFWSVPEPVGGSP
jgi:hypothetical protein